MRAAFPIAGLVLPLSLPLSLPLILPLILSGCISESADIGRPPPVLLETEQAVLRASDRSPRDAAIRAKVRRAITDIGAGDLQSVRVRIYARSARDAEGLRRMLVGIGADPARLTVEPRRASANRLVLTRAVAETTPCATAIAPTYAGDPLPSLMSLAQCTHRPTIWSTCWLTPESSSRPRALTPRTPSTWSTAFSRGETVALQVADPAAAMGPPEQAPLRPHQRRLRPHPGNDRTRRNIGASVGMAAAGY